MPHGVEVEDILDSVSDEDFYALLEPSDGLDVPAVMPQGTSGPVDSRGIWNMTDDELRSLVNHSEGPDVPNFIPQCGTGPGDMTHYERRSLLETFELGHAPDPSRRAFEELWSKLEPAAANGDIATIKEAVELRWLVPREPFMESAIVAINNGHLSIVSMLLDAGLPVDSCLVRAALDTSQPRSYLQLFVTSGWDVNASLSQSVSSVLALAAERDDLELVKWLLQNFNADVDTESDMLSTPLGRALRYSTRATIDILLNRPFDPEKGQLMHQALWRALEEPQWDTHYMDILLAKGAPINKLMHDCETDTVTSWQLKAVPFGTPLHIAVKKNSAVAVEYLLRHGARSDRPDEVNKTPLDIATGEIRQLLLNHRRNNEAMPHL